MDGLFSYCPYCSHKYPYRDAKYCVACGARNVSIQKLVTSSQEAETPRTLEFKNNVPVIVRKVLDF